MVVIGFLYAEETKLVIMSVIRHHIMEHQADCVSACLLILFSFRRSRSIEREPKNNFLIQMSFMSSGCLHLTTTGDSKLKPSRLVYIILDGSNHALHSETISSSRGSYGKTYFASLGL
jgi:hypothetical protein